MCTTIWVPRCLDNSVLNSATQWGDIVGCGTCTTMRVFTGASYTYYSGPVGSGSDDSFDEYYQASSFTSARYDGDRPRSTQRRDYNR